MAMKSTLRIYLLLFLLIAQGLHAQVLGCTDPLSKNYNPAATHNDGSCVYDNIYIKPVASVGLPDRIRETSGLIRWARHLYTHNDNNDNNLYALDTLTGEVMLTFKLEGVSNNDWEEIAQDEDYFYIGDFGNNTGHRKNLSIIKISQEGFVSGIPSITTIDFTYPTPTGSESTSSKTEYDCEAFIVRKDSIYLFTKNWGSGKTSLYSLPNVPGQHATTLLGTYDVEGLVTGAAYSEDKGVVVLTGYNKRLQPFFYLLYDFKGNNFFSGNKRKIKIDLPFHQIESIATSDGLTFYCTNEYFKRFPFIRVEAQLHRFDLSPFFNQILTQK